MFGRVGFRVFGAIVAGAALAGIGVGVSGGLVTTSSTPQPAPTIAVLPHTNLVDLQSVLVVGSHFSPQAFLGTVECTTNAVDANSCDLSTLVYSNANGSGAFALHRPVRRILDIGGKSVDCAVPKACTLGVGDIADLTDSATAPISFNPAVPPIITKIRPVPATKLRDHQLVTVKGQGFNPGSQVNVTECATNTSSPFDCAFETNRNAVAASDGTFSIPNYALEREFVSFDGNGVQTVDCAATPHTCVLRTDVGGFGKTIDGPLSFDRTVPPVVPAISVLPSTKLGDLQLVTVKGFGFLPGAPVDVAECATATFGCDPGAQTVTAGFHGQFTLTMAVHRRLAGEGLVGVITVDCADHLGACAIEASAPGSLFGPSVSLSFDPKKAPAPTIITAHPSSHLTDNQRIAVTLKGFAPFRPLAVVECAAEAITKQDLSYCDNGAVTVTTSPAGGGHPSALMFVHRQIAGQNGLVDCSSHSGACVLLAVPYQYIGYGGIGGSSSVSVGGGLSVAKAPRTGRLGYTSGVAGALPVPDNGGRAVRAVPGSRIPGIAVLPLDFTP